jgi:hypothetical protein
MIFSDGLIRTFVFENYAYWLTLDLPAVLPPARPKSLHEAARRLRLLFPP